MFGKSILIIIALAFLCAPLHAQQRPRPKQNLRVDELPPLEVKDREAEFYRIVDVPMPPGAVVEPSNILEVPDGRLVIGA